MRAGYHVEQVFLRTRAGRVEIGLGLVAPSGVTKRETLQTETAEPAAALEQVARLLALRPDIDSAKAVRLRLERGGGLQDDAELKARFVAAFEGARR